MNKKTTCRSINCRDKWFIFYSELTSDREKDK